MTIVFRLLTFDLAVLDLSLQQWYVLVLLIGLSLTAHAPFLPTAGTHLAHYKLDDDLIIPGGKAISQGKLQNYELFSRSRWNL